MQIAEKKQEDIYTAQRLQDKGMSKSAIGRQMGIPESSVRNLLKPGAIDKARSNQVTSDMLKREVDDKGMIDVGVGVEHHVGVTRSKLDNCYCYGERRRIQASYYSYSSGQHAW